MQVKLWGVRGSVPSPLDPRDYRSRINSVIEKTRDLLKKNPSLSADEIREKLPAHIRDLIGGETTCVELREGSEQLIFDMGTGARRLGYDMMARGVTGDIHILMTHTHWDHIQGWPFFIPAYIPGNQIHFHSSIKDCEQRFRTQQIFDFFPLALDQMMSKRDFHSYEPGDSFKIGSLKIRTESLIHPGNSTAYRVEKGKKSFIFATDTEFFGPDLEEIVKRKAPFFKGADCLIMDAQYSVKESEQKIGWGHTSMLVAVDCAVAWKVKRLVLTHHEPAHDDLTTMRMLEEAQAYLDERYAGKLELILAREGDTIEI
ncbi:MAG: MBL fold metallo-hydrolase [Spirochaetae bacterium HGW-Spirochaetae-10]|nr:MAG: MBL fold metallo-hydrolase [Spirochaetae bacterium HGW-Spirochaetae-10]